MEKFKNWFNKLDLRLVMLLLLIFCWGPAFLIGELEGSPGYNTGILDPIIAGLYIAPFAIIGLIALYNTLKR